MIHLVSFNYYSSCFKNEGGQGIGQGSSYFLKRAHELRKLIGQNALSVTVQYRADKGWAMKRAPRSSLAVMCDTE